MYHFAERLLRSDLIGLPSALCIGLVSPNPLGFFSWGGGSEIVGDHLLLTFLGFFVSAPMTNDFSMAAW